MKPGKIHVLEDTLSRAPHATVNLLEVLKIDLEDVIGGYKNDKFYGAIMKAIDGEEIFDEVLKRKIKKLLPLFHRDWKKVII